MGRRLDRQKCISKIAIYRHLPTKAETDIGTSYSLFTMRLKKLAAIHENITITSSNFVFYVVNANAQRVSECVEA